MMKGVTLSALLLEGYSHMTLGVSVRTQSDCQPLVLLLMKDWGALLSADRGESILMRVVGKYELSCCWVLLLAQERKVKERSREQMAFWKEPNQWEILKLTKNKHDNCAASKEEA